MMFALMMVVFSIFPGLADILSDFVGTYSTSNFIFMFVIFILLVKVFFLSLKISQLESRVTELIQQMALDRKEDADRKDDGDRKEDGNRKGVETYPDKKGETRDERREIFKLQKRLRDRAVCGWRRPQSFFFSSSS